MIDTTSRPVRMVFTGRAAGDLSLEDTRRTLGEKLGIERQVWMEQLHTNTVTVVDGAHGFPG